MHSKVPLLRVLSLAFWICDFSAFSCSFSAFSGFFRLFFGFYKEKMKVPLSSHSDKRDIDFLSCEWDKEFKCTSSNFRNSCTTILLTIAVLKFSSVTPLLYLSPHAVSKKFRSPPHVSRSNENRHENFGKASQPLAHPSKWLSFTLVTLAFDVWRNSIGMRRRKTMTTYVSLDRHSTSCNVCIFRCSIKPWWSSGKRRWGTIGTGERLVKCRRLRRKSLS